LSLDPKNLKPIIIEELSSILAERLGTILRLADDLGKLGADDAAAAATKLADDIGKTGKSVSALRKSSDAAERELGKRYQRLSRQRANLRKGTGSSTGRATAKGAQALGASGMDELKVLIDKGATSIRLPAAGGREAITVTVTREGGKAAVRSADDVAAQGMDDVAGLLGQAEAAAAKGDSNKVIEIFKQLDGALEKLPGVGRLYATRLGKAYAVADVSSRVVTGAVDDESWSVPQWLVKTLGTLVIGGALAGTLYFSASDSDEVDVANMGQEEVNLGQAKAVDITSKLKAVGVYQPGNIYTLTKPSRKAGKDSKYRGKVVISKYKGSQVKPEKLVARFISDPGGNSWSFVEIRGNDEISPVTLRSLYRKSGDPDWRAKLKDTQSKLKSVL
tara:strand:+ start:5940 stop:7112 length:1173 start_codon:yes stop_codon:yes gene_type:complete